VGKKLTPHFFKFSRLLSEFSTLFKKKLPFWTPPPPNFLIRQLKNNLWEKLWSCIFQSPSQFLSPKSRLCLKQISYIPLAQCYQQEIYTTSVFSKFSVVQTLDAGSNKNIKDIEILLKKNWNFPKHIFNKNIERNI
jgi:hypothetical protein